MKEQLISFETAKLAKDKGFNVSVRHSFGHDINPHIAYPNEDYSIPNDFNSPNIGRNWKSRVSAPTQSLLQKWLREKHNIDITIQCFKYQKLKNNYGWDVEKEWNENIVSQLPIASYEEALEEALQEALKLI